MINAVITYGILSKPHGMVQPSLICFFQMTLYSLQRLTGRIVIVLVMSLRVFVISLAKKLITINLKFSSLRMFVLKLGGITALFFILTLPLIWGNI